MANHAPPFRGRMPKPDFILVGHHRQVNGRVKPLLRFRQRQPVRRLQRQPALDEKLVCHFVLHIGIVCLQAIPPCPRAERGGMAGNCLAGDNWQNCRSLDEAMIPVRRLFGSGWSWFKPSAIQMRCVSLSPTQWPPPPGVRLTPLGVVLDGVSSLFAAGLPKRGRPTRKA